MVEPDRQQPPAGHMLDTTMAAARAQVSVQVGDRLADTRVVGGQHRSSGGRIAQAVEMATLRGGRHAIRRCTSAHRWRARSSR